MARPVIQFWPPSHPQNSLSIEARQRIQEAFHQSLLIRNRALADIETQYRCETDEKPSGALFSDYLGRGQTGIQWRRALLDAARVPLLRLVEEYRAAGIAGKEFRALMEEEVYNVVSSFELSNLQRDVLWGEIDAYNEPDPVKGPEETPDRTSVFARPEKPEPTHQERMARLNEWRLTAGTDGAKLSWEEAAHRIHMNVTDLRAARGCNPKAPGHPPRLYAFIDNLK